MTRAVVAVDGPAGSGKSTVAQGVARAMGLEVLDTGAMYRAVTWAVLAAGVDPHDAEAVGGIAHRMTIEVGEGVRVDGSDVTVAIRGPDVTAAVSVVSAHPAVRQEMVTRQRQWIEARSGGVVEGRDIGTVVFPDAPVKVFLVADAGTRAARRRGDEVVAARDPALGDVRADLERRDLLDSTRKVAPLRPADDAVVIDTTDLSVEDVVARVLDEAREAGL